MIPRPYPDLNIFSSKSGGYMYKTTNCQVCNIEFKFCDSSSFGKYCSNKCQGIAKRQKSAKRIEEGLVRSPETLKPYLAELHGNKCATCHISEWQGKPLSLHLDHIDGNSDNNFPSNLRLLCPNCHSQTETFSGRNKKNTKRSSYNKRYRHRKLVAREGIEPSQSPCKDDVLPLN